MDLADVVSPEKQQFLADGLVGFGRTQQREISVITVPDLQGYDIDSFANQLALEWGLAEPWNDDGAVLIVAPKEMQVSIVVGSTVRSRLPENVAREIIDAQVLPSFRDGDMDNGILNGAGSILYYLELTPEEAAALAEQERLELAQAEKSEGVPWGALGVLLLLVLCWPILRVFLGFVGLAGGAITLIGSVGSGSGFGGFGRGSSGGGGASGRW